MCDGLDVRHAGCMGLDEADLVLVDKYFRGFKIEARHRGDTRDEQKKRDLG